MRTAITIREKTGKVNFEKMNIYMHPNLPGLEMAYLTIKIGENEVSISFDSGDEAIEFCQKHNPFIHGA